MIDRHEANLNLLNLAGVHDAIKKMYLQRLYFGISSNAEGTRLIEASSSACKSVALIDATACWKLPADNFSF